jgi:hypothetical protein
MGTLKKLTEKLIGTRTPARKRAVILIDYEYWHISLSTKWGVVPNIKGFFEKMSETYDIVEANVYGDFSNPAFEPRLPRIRAYATAINTGRGDMGVKKDFTDFIVLDALYQKAISPHIGFDVAVLLTGDGHFAPAVNTLRKLGVDVVVHGVKGTFSRQLKDAATAWTETPEGDEYLDYAAKKLVKSIRHMADKWPNFVFYYDKTIAHVAKRSGYNPQIIRMAMERLVRDGLVTRHSYHEIRVCWDACVSAGLVFSAPRTDDGLPHMRAAND